MNRINPLYSVLLCVALFIFFLYITINQKNEFSEIKSSYKESLILAKELAGLKKAYTKKFRLSSYESKHLSSKSTKSGVIISADSINSKILNSFMRKILNNNYNIQSLDIKKINESKVKLYMEIKW